MAAPATSAVVHLPDPHGNAAQYVVVASHGVFGQSCYNDALEDPSIHLLCSNCRRPYFAGTICVSSLYQTLRSSTSLSAKHCWCLACLSHPPISMRALVPSASSAAVCSRSTVIRPRSVAVRAAEGFCRDKVNVDGKKFESQGKVYKLKFVGVGEQAIEVDCPDDMYILEAAEQAGLDLPATCKAGICGTCVGRIAQGSIDPSDIADIEFTISKEEQEQGLAMLCMSRACSDLVIETQCDWGYSLGVQEWQGATGKFSGTPDPLMGKKWQENSNN